MINCPKCSSILLVDYDVIYCKWCKYSATIDEEGHIYDKETGQE